MSCSRAAELLPVWKGPWSCWPCRGGGCQTLWGRWGSCSGRRRWHLWFPKTSHTCWRSLEATGGETKSRSERLHFSKNHNLCFRAFTQKDVSAGAHISPPLLHDLVKLVSQALVQPQAEGRLAFNGLEDQRRRRRAETPRWIWLKEMTLDTQGVWWTLESGSHYHEHLLHLLGRAGNNQSLLANVRFQIKGSQQHWDLAGLHIQEDNLQRKTIR